MSQAAVILPGSPLTGAAAAADMNAAWAGMTSKFSGVTAPTLGPGTLGALVAGQDWLDTSVNPYVWRVWDGTQWVVHGFIDPTNHLSNSALSWRNIAADNGGFEVWQRGAGASATFAVSATSTAYTADRWYLNTNANQACTVAAVAGLVNGSRLACKVQRNNGQTGVGVPVFGFPLDTDECAMIQGKIVTISFTAKAGANWSPAGGLLVITLSCGTGTPVKFVVGYIGGNFPINALNAPLTTTPTRFSFVSSAVPTNTTQAEIDFSWVPVGTAGADDSFTVDDVQMEVESAATPFERTPFEKSMLGCKRHYAKTFAYGTAPAQNAGVVGALGANTQVVTADVSWNWNFPVSMRVNPTITTYNPSAANSSARNVTGAADVAISVDPNTALSPDRVFIETTATIAAQNSNIYLHVAADAGI